MRDTLIITDKTVPSPVPPAQAYEYRIDGGNISDEGTKIINDPDKINQLGTDLAQTYTDGIASLRQTMPWKTLHDETLGFLFYFTELNTKRTEINESYDALVNAIYLREKLSNATIRFIYVYGSHFLKNDTLCSAFPEATIIRASKDTKRPCLRAVFINNLYYFLRFWLVALSRWHVPKPKHDDLIAKRFFMTRFPGRLSADEVEDKFFDLVCPDNRYIAGILTDGMQQNLSFTKWWKVTAQAKQLKQTIFYDRYHHVSDGFAGFFWMLSLMAKISKSKISLTIDKIDISQIIRSEAIYSLYRLPRLITVSRALSRLYARINTDHDHNKSIVYYLHEYGYGRMYTSLLARFFPHLKRIGMQHGPASVRKLVYWLSPHERDDQTHNLTMPQAILAEDPASAALYRKMGYPHVLTMKSPPRLRKSFATSVTISKNRLSLPFLIATGLHDSDIIISMMAPIMAKNNSQEYLVKFHPKAIVSAETKAALPSNCTIVKEDISTLFAKIRRVYVTYSSVGNEAIDHGLDVCYVDIPGRVSERPDAKK